MIIRPASADDIPAIAEIYNEAILNTTATFDTEPKSLEERVAWFDNHDARHPVIIAFDDSVIGWAALSPWSDRQAYQDTAEVSVYVRSDRRGTGTGKQLLTNLIARGQEAGLHTLIARIADGNPASIALHHSLGFESVGTLKEVGMKFERWIDVRIFQLMLEGMMPSRLQDAKNR